ANQAERSSLTAAQIQLELAQSRLPVYLVVPEQFTLQAEHVMMRHLKSHGFMQLRILSPSRLTDEVFGRTRKPKRTLIDERGLAMALNHIAQQCQPQLTAYRRIAHFPGFSKAFLQFVSQFKQCDIPLSAFEEAGQTGNTLLRAKMHDLALLYGKLQEHLAQNQYMDHNDRLAHFIAAIPLDEQLRSAVVYFDGFSYFTPRECRMVGELMAVCRQVNVSLGDEEQLARQTDLFLPMRRIEQRLCDMAEQLAEPVQRLRYRPGAVNGLRAVVPQAFCWSPAQRQSAAAQQMVAVAAGEKEEEIEACAAYIAHMVRTRPARYRDFLVACNDLEGYAPAISRLFERYRIPCFIDRKREITRNPVVRFLVQALRALSDGFRWQDVIGIAKTGVTGLTDDETEALQAYAMAFDLSGRQRWSRDFHWGADTYDLAGLNALRHRVMAPVNLLTRATAGSKKTGAHWADALFQTICSMDARQKLDDMAQCLQQGGYADEAAICRRIWNALMETFDQFHEILGGTLLTPRQALEILQSSLEQTQVGILPTSADEVPVGDIGRSKNVEVRYLIVLGAAEGSLSALQSDESVFSDLEMQELSGRGVALDRDSAFLTAQKQYDLYNLFSSCTDMLYVSWCRYDADGQDTAADRLVLRLMELAGLEKGDILPARRIFERPVERQGSAGQLAALLRGYLAGNSISPAQQQLLCWYRAQDEYRPRVEKLIGWAVGQQEPQTVPGVEPLRKISVTQLESYAHCPLAFGMTHLLRPAPLAKHGVDAAKAGVYLHAAMEEFSHEMRRLTTDFAQLDEKDAQDAMRHVTAALEQEFEYGLLHRSHTLRWSAQAMNRILSRAAATWLTQMQEGSFVPFGQEIRFGRSDMAVVDLSRGDMPAELQGRIDRVDIF
ncbi:MAG: exodeoxyribonuclease V subunit gamma, partial [Eubacteriales bacterium]|nr:exodeoxyribonuclease V subunit gamma [Eubacteriales bacterium]